MDTALGRIAVAIEEEVRPDLLMVLLPGVDRVSHHLWGNMEPAGKVPTVGFGLATIRSALREAGPRFRDLLRATSTRSSAS